MHFRRADVSIGLSDVQIRSGLTEPRTARRISVRLGIMTDLRYPIGRVTYAGESTEEQRRAFIDRIENTPARLRAAVEGLTPEQLDTPYRPGGWTVRQLVHHVPDSHMHSYCRFRLALTEDTPSVKGYDQERWEIGRASCRERV